MKGKVINVKGNVVTVLILGNKPALKAADHIVISSGKTRTLAMNNLYWEMLEIIQSGTGHSKDELHEYYKREFLGDKIEIMGEPFIYSRSTTKLTTKEFAKYLSDIRRHVWDNLGFDLPID